MTILAKDLNCKTQAGRNIKAEVVVKGWHGIKESAAIINTQPPVSIWNIYTKLPIVEDQVVYTYKPEGQGWTRATIIEPVSELFKEEKVEAEPHQEEKLV